MSALVTAIGLEVHVELSTRSKVFCRCAVPDGEFEPNAASCPVCQGQPGTLPALNPCAVNLGVRCALALNSDVQMHSTFERKHYVYPDLPKNYQITQNDTPLALTGHLSIPGSRAPLVRVGIIRVHLEEDAAKLEHRLLERRRASLVDFNRCGVPLLEIVTKPDLVEPEDASTFLQRLQHIVRWHRISGAEMSKGRCAATPILPPDNLPLSESVRWEIKNLNSFEAVIQSLRRARERQRSALKSGLSPRSAGLKQTTFRWDAERGEILRRREKETNDDYFYFVEPDLVELRLDESKVEEIRGAMGPGPDVAQETLVRARVSDECAANLTKRRAVFRSIGRRRCSFRPEGAVTIANLIDNNLRACANRARTSLEECLLSITSAGWPIPRGASIQGGSSEAPISITCLTGCARTRR